jgi:hypothetical protein
LIGLHLSDFLEIHWPEPRSGRTDNAMAELKTSGFLAYAPGVAMPREIEAEQEAVPSSGGAGTADLPDGRGD